jgi:hypothetical protein
MSHWFSESFSWRSALSASGYAIQLLLFMANLALSRADHNLLWVGIILMLLLCNLASCWEIYSFTIDLKSTPAPYYAPWNGIALRFLQRKHIPPKSGVQVLFMLIENRYPEFNPRIY